ncbi:pilin [Patescibacteria group bacterium]|nr:pilin [Patescibacteria group bacterium]
MKRIFFKFAVLFFVILIFFLLRSDNAFANITTTPDKDSIDETVLTVSVTFDNLIPGATYFLCNRQSTKFCFGLADAAFVKMPRIDANSDGTLSLSVCGGEEYTVKRDCKTGRDWFYGGHMYGFTLFNGKTREQAATAQFYVHYYFPELENISISPDNPTPGGQVTVSMSQKKLRQGGDDRNSYKLTLKNDATNKHKDSNCTKITQADTPVSINVPKNSNELNAGSYTLSIKGCDKVDDIDFYEAQVIVDQTNGSVGELIKDPLLTDIQAANDEAPLTPPPPPCATLGPNGSCKEVNTAIGQIATDPTGFIKSIFSLILGFSGGIALLLIILSGYKLMESRGNPERLEGAKDQLTSAIIGLLFIIFSLVILQIIGVDILQIPGLGK